MKNEHVPMQLALSDLVFLRKAQIAIDEETFASVLRFENEHHDFTSCLGCCAITFAQHQPCCPRASILFQNNWFEILAER